jgi:hypothetical protein
MLAKVLSVLLCCGVAAAAVTASVDASGTFSEASQCPCDCNGMQELVVFLTNENQALDAKCTERVLKATVCVCVDAQGT